MSIHITQYFKIYFQEGGELFISKATEDDEEELIITKLNNLYKIIDYEKFCLFSDTFMSEIEEYKLNKQELNSSNLLRLL